MEEKEQKQNLEGKKPVFYQAPHEKSKIGHVLAVMSGKGGVGKSLVTALAAVAMQKAGFSSAILDGDITGPSIPRSFGLSGMLEVKDGIPYAKRTKTGIQVVSTNLLLDKETDPVLWKGPMVAQGLKQFWSDIVYEDVDYLFVDMPPGTGDVPLTVFQTLPIDGVLIVTSPQDLVTMIVEKAIHMTQMMDVPVLGLVENMSYFRAPDTGKTYEIFGKSHLDQIAQDFGLPVLARLPIHPAIAELVDAGRIEEADLEDLKPLIASIVQLLKK